jgi:antitoxin YefM
MKNISVENDIVPIGEFKTRISKWINKSKKSRHPIIITQNGKPAAVVLTPNDFDQLQEMRQFTDSVSRGLTDADEGKVLTTQELTKELARRRQNGKGK